VGEFHTVADHKEHLKTLLNGLIQTGVIQNFALEFTRAEKNDVLQQYLTDTSAIPNSTKEADYFGQLHRAYSSMFDNSHYDSILRQLRSLKLSGLKFNVCAVDEPALDADTSDSGPKFQKLSAMPEAIRLMIERLSESPLEAIAKTDAAWDREARMGLNIAQCGNGLGKTLAFVGLIHALDLERTKLQIKWANAIQYTKKLRSVSSLALWHAYLHEQELLPIFKKSCIDRTKNRALQVVDNNKIDESLAPCFTITEGSYSFSYQYSFDGFVIGPAGIKIDE